jgi:hypothetical protein
VISHYGFARMGHLAQAAVPLDLSMAAGHGRYSAHMAQSPTPALVGRRACRARWSGDISGHMPSLLIAPRRARRWSTFSRVRILQFMHIRYCRHRIEEEIIDAARVSKIPPKLILQPLTNR